MINIVRQQFIEKIHQENTKKLSSMHVIAKVIYGCILEFFSVLAVMALYCVPQSCFDPKEQDIQKDASGKALEAPILLVHGYLHNSSGWIAQRRRLKKAGFKNIFTVDLGAIPNKSIADYGKILSQRVEKIQRLTGRKDIKLIGHSMGGVVSSYYALHLASEKNIDVTDVITLNSPLRGTKMHFFGPGTCARNMAFNCPFIKALSQKIKNSTKTRFFHIASSADFVVLPYYSALNTEKKIHEVKENMYVARGLGHMAALFSKKIIEIEIEYLKCHSIEKGMDAL